MKIFNTFLKVFLLWLIIGFQPIQLFGNNPPDFDVPVDDSINVITGQNVLLLSNVDDGEVDSVQNIIFTAETNDTNSIAIDSVVYNAGDQVALLYLTEKGLLDTVNISVSAQDQVDFDQGGSTIITKIFDLYITGYNNPGVNYTATQTEHWQDPPIGEPITPKPGQEYILDQTQANDLCKENFFWGKMWGYITPPRTGLYNFAVTEGEGAGFFLSTDATPENLPPKYEPTASDGKFDWWGSKIATDIPFEAGKMYYFEVYHREIVVNYNLKLEWSGPGVSSGYITSESLTYEVDQYLPKKPENFSLITTGVNDVVIKWDEGFDRGTLVGYNVYINGVKVNTNILTATNYVAAGLSPETNYSVQVRAVDSYGNLSEPSDVINFTTYQIDNIAPSIPQNLSLADETGISMLLEWDPSNDDETEVRGYNLYVDGTPVMNNPNEELIYTNSYWLKELSPNTNYNITVTAFDAGLNESPESTLLSASTGDFCATCNQDSVKKGRYTASIDPIAKNIGNGTGWVVSLGSKGAVNNINFPYFEYYQIENASTKDDLKAYNKSIKDMIFEVDPTDPYEGKYSAKLTGKVGSKFIHNGGTDIINGHTYMIIFANKKSPGYTGDIKVKYRKQYSATFINNKSVTPTDSWKLDTLEFTATDDYPGALQYIEFSLTEIGAVYIDNIQLYDKTWYDGSAFTTKVKEITEELAPSHLRWGGLNPNHYSLKYCIGKNPSQTVSIGDFMNYANEIGAGTSFVMGISDKPDHPTDWYNDPENTVNLFMEYIAGDTTTEGGKIRASEGYIDNFLDNSPMIMIEFGCEVWGGRGDGVNHGSPFSGEEEYGEWARMMGKHIKNSPYYDPEKVVTAYSGRHMNHLTWNQGVYGNDTGTVDYLAVSGYNGGNLNYDVDVPKSESELGYHKSMIALMMRKFQETKENVWPSMINNTGRILPMYFYETDVTNTAYQKRVGQAVNYIDYIATSKKNGFNWDNHSMMFGSQWGLLDGNYGKNPQYHTIQLFNHHCKGAVLDGEFLTNDYIKDDQNIKVNADPVGCHAYNNDTIYSFMFCSRDFEKNYTIQLDLPDTINFNQDAEMYVFSGDAFNSTQITIDTIDISNFSDSIIINVPKYSVVYIKAIGEPSGITDVPWNNFEYKKATSIEIICQEGTDRITQSGGRLHFSAIIEPADATFPSARWELLNNDIGVLMYNGIVLAPSTTGVVDTVIIKASSGSDASDTYELIIDLRTDISEEQEDGQAFELYPNPGDNFVNIDLPSYSEGCVLEITSIQGVKIKQLRIDEQNAKLNVNDLEKGIYLIKAYMNSGEVITRRFIKK